MKHFVDGDQLCVTLDDFVNLQESPAYFLPLADERAQAILAGGVRRLPFGDLQHIFWSLKNNLAAKRIHDPIALELQKLIEKGRDDDSGGGCAA